jgi:selenide,water dikinase
MARFRVGAATDVTGFGLAGHLLEMARASGRDIILDSGRIPVIEGVEEFASMGLVPAGAHKNRNFFGGRVRFGANVSRFVQDIVFDPQTSGGLVISMDGRDVKECVAEMEEFGIQARIIGEVKEAESCGALLVE